MVHDIASRKLVKDKELHKDDYDTSRAIFIRLGIMAALLGLGGGLVGYLLNDGHLHASMFIGFGAVMICVGLGAGVMIRMARQLPGGSSRAVEARVRSVAEMVVGTGLFVTVAAIMSPFVQSAVIVGFRNISSAEQYAIVAVGLGLMAALGSLFWEQR